VFERAGKNADIYVACSLQPWVSESRVIGQSLGTTCADDDLQLMLDQRDLTLPRRHTPSIPSQIPKQPKDRRGALARLSILPQKGSSGEIRSEVGVSVEESLQTPNSISHGATVEVPISSPLDVDQLRLQYFETLYLSKTSLGYFSKGPLARARTMVQQEKLMNFYQESIITTKKLDLKYKESVNKVIESATSSQPAAGSAGDASRKASRKKKMGKNALYPAEEEYVRRCWLEREIRHSKSISAQSQAQDQRKLVSDLRTRETKMQILLILELQALEAGLLKPEESTKVTEVVIKTEEQSDNTAAVLTETPIKTKPSPKNYSSDLETLADRLCIWHTVGIEDMLDSPEKDQQARKSSNRKDELGDFCAEAIIPFYASRLPEQCKMICRKLGGPEISPQVSKTASTKSISTTRLPPGAAIQRRPRAVPKKTLERVLSDDRSMRHASPPTLTRSATAPLVANIKREPSETFQRPASRGALHKSVSFTNREIDLHADARIQEAKRRKLARVAEQKKELDAAIAALKKPNRTAAAQRLMDEVENRSLDTTRKQPVHITATPRRPKSGASKRHEPDLPPTFEVGTSLDEHMVPSSTVRPSHSGQWQPPASAKKQAVLFTIHETPTRTPSTEQVLPKPVSRLNFQSATESDNFSSDPTLVESTPATNRLRPDLFTQIQNTPMRMTKSMRPVLFTPLKKTEVRVEDVFRDAPIIPAGAGTAMDRVMGGGSTELSVYDALGWNDDYDL
jgi:DNA replication regulator SLD3